jgi:hypothetical protein
MAGQVSSFSFWGATAAVVLYILVFGLFQKPILSLCGATSDTYVFAAAYGGMWSSRRRSHGPQPGAWAASWTCCPWRGADIQPDVYQPAVEAWPCKDRHEQGGRAPP